MSQEKNKRFFKMQKKHILMAVLVILATVSSVYFLLPNKNTGKKAGLSVDSSTHESFEQLWLGSETATVELVMYSSYTCPYCVSWYNVVLPHIKNDFIDTGKIRFSIIPFPSPPLNLSHALSILNTCFDSDKYYKVRDALFQANANIARLVELEKNNEQGFKKFKENEIHILDQSYGFLQELATTFGMSKEKLDECIFDGNSLKRLLDVREEALSKHKINAVPSFTVNNKRVKMTGNMYLSIVNALNEALEKQEGN